MRRTTRQTQAARRRAAALLLLALALPACGMKAAPGEVSVESADLPDVVTSAPAALAPAAASATPSDAASAPPPAGTAAPTRAAAPARLDPTRQASGSSPTPSAAGTTTGIDDDRRVVRIALHGLSGEAGAAAQAYWREGPGGRPRTLKNGYTVEPVVFDAGSDRASAARRCAQQARSAFLVYGASGPDQIAACATNDALRRATVPYLSTGVGEAGLRALPHYFATSLTYEQQAPLLVRAARDGGWLTGRWAVVTPEGDAYEGAATSMVGALRGTGAQLDPERDVYEVDPAPRDCSTLGSALRDGRYTAIYFLTPQPTFFAQCVNAVGSGPTFTGPGATLAYDPVASLACSASGQRVKAVYLHPVTGLDQAADRARGRSFDNGPAYHTYAAMQTLHAALDLVGGRLTRERFVQQLRTGRLPDGIAPGVRYDRGPFGGTAAYALQARCGGGSPANGFRTLARYDR